MYFLCLHCFGVGAFIRSEICSKTIAYYVLLSPPPPSTARIIGASRIKFLNISCNFGTVYRLLPYTSSVNFIFSSTDPGNVDSNCTISIHFNRGTFHRRHRHIAITCLLPLLLLLSQGLNGSYKSVPTFGSSQNWSHYLLLGLFLPVCPWGLHRLAGSLCECRSSCDGPYLHTLFWFSSALKFQVVTAASAWICFVCRLGFGYKSMRILTLVG